MGTPFSRDILQIDAERVTERIIANIRSQARKFKKQGAIVALSGGIDSSVVGALCVRALGQGHVFGLALPEKESSEETRRLSRLIIEHLGIENETVEVTPILEALGSYRCRDEAIRRLIPEYGPEWRCKIVLPSIMESDYRFFSVVVQHPAGETRKVRLTSSAYLEVLAATNYKQRVRKMLEYYHADRLNYLVAGTPNRLEYDQGFFVKQGDGAADIKPIAHLYKTQVYRLAEYLEIPEAVRSRPPTTDTYSLPQSQEEFFFSLPYDQMDLCLFGYLHGVGASEVGNVIGVAPALVIRVFRDIEAKRAAAAYLHMPPVLVDPAESH